MDNARSARKNGLSVPRIRDQLGAAALAGPDFQIERYSALLSSAASFSCACDLSLCFLFSFLKIIEYIDRFFNLSVSSMEGERKSVFERLGTIRPKQSGGNSVQGNAIRGGHDLKREDLRHRVLHLTKRRSHHPGQISQYHQHNMGLKRAKFNHTEPPTLPPPQPKTIRRRRKKPRVIDEENLDEGEIIDDEDDWEEYEIEDEEEEGEIDFKKV